MQEQEVVNQLPEEEQKPPRYANCIEELLALIKRRAPLIWVITHEEDRFIAEFNYS